MVILLVLILMRTAQVILEEHNRLRQSLANGKVVIVVFTIFVVGFVVVLLVDFIVVFVITVVFIILAPVTVLMSLIP